MCMGLYLGAMLSAATGSAPAAMSRSAHCVYISGGATWSAYHSHLRMARPAGSHGGSATGNVCWLLPLQCGMLAILKNCIALRGLPTSYER